MAKRGRYSRGPVGLSRMTDRSVMRFVAPEKKFFDVIYTAYTLAPGNPLIGPIMNEDLAGNTGGIIQGSGATQRIGSKIALESIQLKLVARTPCFILANMTTAAHVPVNPQYRVVLIHDKQANGTVASVADIFSDDTSSIANDGATQSRNLSNISRFSILYDKVHTLKRHFDGTTTSMAFASTEKVININKKFKKPVVIEYAVGSPDGIASVVRKHQFLLAVLPAATDFRGTLGTPTDRNLIVDGGCRLRFSDA